MKRPALLSANNYSLFKSNAEQRPLNAKHVRDLRDSIKRHGFLPSKPIQCVRNGDTKLVIVDGHHRLAAAQEAGSEVYYVIEAEQGSQTMSDVNRFSRKWANVDFIRQYAIRGLRDYRVLQGYIDRGLPALYAAAMLAGETASSGNVKRTLAGGNFKVKTTDQADRVVSLIESHPDNDTLRNRNFISALSLCLWLPEFDFGTFKHRVDKNASMLPRCSNRDDFLEAIETIYNFGTRNRIPLAFNARQAAKKRSAV